MKKLLAFLLALSMLFALAACGGNEDAQNNKEEETTEAPKPATLEEALANTAAELEAADNLTIKLTADIKGNEDFGDLDETVSMDMKLHLDAEAKAFSAVAEVELDGETNSVFLHDSNAIYYDEEAETYYKMDVSEYLDLSFDANAEAQSLEDIIDQLPAETLEMVEEVIDVDKLIELAEKLDTEALAEQLNYTTTTNGDTITHTYKPDIVSMVETVLEQVKDAFVEKEIYYAILMVIDELTEEGNIELALEMDQIDDKISTFRVSVSMVDEDTLEIFALDCALELTDIGTTEVDLEELDEILDKAVDAPTGPVMGEGSIVGLVEGTSYYNEYMALCCDLYEDEWAVAGAEEASVLVGLAAEPVSAEVLLDQVGVFCDFYALNSDGASSVNIMVQMENEETLELTNEEFIRLNATSIAPALEAAGYSNVQIAEGIIGFADADYDCLFITAEAENIILYETQVIVRFGDYAMIITAASYGEDLTGEFLSYFYSFN